jgi:hypothetical protein
MLPRASGHSAFDPYPAGGSVGRTKLRSIERAMMDNPVRSAHQHRREAAWFCCDVRCVYVRPYYEDSGFSRDEKIPDAAIHACAPGGLGNPGNDRRGHCQRSTRLDGTQHSGAGRYVAVGHHTVYRRQASEFVIRQAMSTRRPTRGAVATPADRAGVLLRAPIPSASTARDSSTRSLVLASNCRSTPARGTTPDARFRRRRCAEAT